jgi:LysM repeat protein
MLNQRSVSRSLLVMVILAALAAVLPLRQLIAQGANLLQNPGFEGTYVTANGSATQLVAPSWSPWNVPHKPSDPGFVNLTPDYRSAANPNRIHGGSAAQEVFTFFATHTGGVFQRVAVTNGSKVRFSAFVNVWSTSLDDPNTSEQPGQVRVQVGIDPKGGTNGESQTIVWSEAQEFYDEYRELSVETTASADFVTVFVKSAPKDPVKNNDTYIDDASLTITGGPAPTNTPVTPNTAVPTTAVPTNTAVAPTATTPPTTAAPTNTQNPNVPTREGTFTPGETDVPVTVNPTSQNPTPIVPTAEGTARPTATPDLSGRTVYTVVAGDTLSDIAARFNSTVEAITQANGIDASGLILVGQQLVIPVPVAPTAVPPTSTPQFGTGGPVNPPSAPVDTAVLNGPTVNGIGTYIVQAGDTMARIAARYNTTVEALAQLNGIVNPNLVPIGQVIVVPGPGNNYPGGTLAPTILPTVPTPVPLQTYMVQPGDNLFRISLRFGVTLDALMRVNGITNQNLIYVGQVLKIP